MCDYPFFIPQVVLFANSSLFWFKVTNEHREFRNYLVYYTSFFPLFFLHVKIGLIFVKICIKNPIAYTMGFFQRYNTI